MIASYNREQKDRLVNAFICEFEAGGRREVLVLPIVPDGMEWNRPMFPFNELQRVQILKYQANALRARKKKLAPHVIFITIYTLIISLLFF